MVLLLGGGVPVSNKVSEGGGTKILQRFRDGVSIFYTHEKETEHNKIPLSRHSPAALDAPFAQFARAAMKIFDSDSGGGYQNFTETPRVGGWQEG